MQLPVAALQLLRRRVSAVVFSSSTGKGPSPTNATPQRQARGQRPESASRNWTALFRASDWRQGNELPSAVGSVHHDNGVSGSSQRRVPLSQALGPVGPIANRLFLGVFILSPRHRRRPAVQSFFRSLFLRFAALLSPEATGAWYRLHSFSRSCPIIFAE